MVFFKYSGDKLRISHSIDTSPCQDDFFLHAHREFEFFYFISGDCYYTVEGTDYSLSPGHILLMRNGEAHTLHVRSSTPYERVSVHFSQDVIPALSDELTDLFFNRPLGKGNLYIPSEDNGKFFSACIKKLCRDSADSEGQIISYLMPILSELHHIKHNHDEQNPSLLIPVQQGSSETVGKIVEYINDNLITINGLEMLEKEFFFSKSYINRIFKESTGSSVWDYIVLKRLLLSRSLLQSGKQANIVASECGFCDYSSFYRQFKKRFGISPLEARKK